MPKLRVGIPPDVACRPLAWGLLKGHHGDLFSASERPAPALTQMISGGRLDVALVSSLDALSLEEVDLLPDLCLSATGEAGLALLVHQGSLGRLRTVASAPGEDNAAALLALVLQLRGLSVPSVSPHQPVLTKMLDASGAAVISGSMAAEAEVPQDYRVLDLVAAWESVSGLPWVGAVWVVRRSVKVPDLSFYFKSSLRYGLSMLDTVVRESAAVLRLEPEVLKARFEAHFSYVLRKRERASLEELARQASKAGLVECPSLPPFRA